MVGGFKKNSGRNSSGKITVFSKKHKSMNYINVDYKRNLSSDLAVCITNLKNTTTSNIVSLIKYSNGSYSYVLSAYGFGPGMFTQFLQRHPIFSTKYVVGSSAFLKNLSVGSIFFNLSLNFFKTASIARSPGTYCILLNFSESGDFCNVQLPSGKVLSISTGCTAVLGRNSNIWSFKEVVGKAGRNFLKGFKPSVRGVAMNPVDHPHGGRTKTNSPEKTPWGKVTKFNK